jgi:hypothetical protein
MGHKRILDILLQTGSLYEASALSRPQKVYSFLIILLFIYIQVVSIVPRRGYLFVG